ncbi:MAG TPA: peroxiredoxin-like family protein [Solirubrobacteraceae bacterium]|nr:peroxiredoxin-like family protein [Solirubrobacteraceae bacterium]
MPKGTDDMVESTIAPQVRALHETAAAAPPNQTMSAFTREQEVLAGVVPDGVISLGTELPDVGLLDPHGAQTTLLSTLDGRRGVLVFYRGAWCPYCNIALAAYQTDLVDALDARDVVLLAVSPQLPDGSLSMQEKHDLRFAVLSDPGNHLARSAGVLTAPSPEARAAQLELGLDLEVVNADATVGIPMPTAVVLEPDATVRWIDVHPDYSTRSEPSEILAALDALGER